MATLTYNGVVINLVRMIGWDSEQVRSFDGVDYLYTKITISVAGVFNPYLNPLPSTTTTISTNPLAPPPPGPNQNAQPFYLGLQMQALLKELLMAPRKQLVFTVGANTVINSPGQDTNGNNLECDANDGPIPLRCKVWQISGDKTANVIYSIETYLSDCNNVVLSNRWTVRSHTDIDAFTTRYINGVAKLRADLMRVDNLTADSFRGAYFPPVPQQFQRELVNATLSSDGTELRYQVQDIEMALAIGSDGVGGRNVTRVEGTVTAGVEFPDAVGVRGKTIKAAIAGAASAPATGGLSVWIAGMYIGYQVVNAYIPTNKANCVIRVWGNRFALKSDLADVACAVAMERLLFGQGLTNLNIFGTVLVSAYMTQSIEDRMVELRCEVLPNVLTNVATAINRLDFGQLMNLNNPVSYNADDAGPFNGVNLNFASGDGLNPAGECPTLFVNNDRGTWFGALLIQALGVSCSIPASPPANATYSELPLE
jgi:hypothetical protein